MGKIKAVLKSDYVDKSGEVPVIIAVSVKRKIVRFKTGLKVNPENWDDAEQRITGPGQKDNNLVIAKSKARVVDIFTKYRLQNRLRELTADLLRKEYEKPSLYLDFHAWLLKTIEGRGDIGVDTKDAHKAIANKLKNFKQSLSFSELTPEFLESFRHEMRYKLENKINTIHNTFKTLKTYTKIAVRDKIIDEDPFKNFKNKQVKPDQIFLMPDELQKLIKKYKENSLPIDKKVVLRQFLFSCFTGLRISDLKKFTKKVNIIGNNIVITPYKTRDVKNEPIKIPINEGAAALLSETDGQFFFYSEQKANIKIKDIAKLEDVKINPKISFKSGRHTFATMFLRQGGSIQALQKILGHSKITQTMEYAHVLDDDIEKEMHVMDKLW